MGADERLVAEFLKKFQDADLDLSTFQRTMHRLVKGAQDKMLEGRVKEILSRELPKALGYDSQTFEAIPV